MDFFIDKLEVYQRHEKKLPLFGSKGFWSFDLETGEYSSEPLVFTKKHEGSYSTSLQIRCDGYTVSVRGNPSRFGRIDNLFGYTTISDCVDLYNSVLAGIGLPPFTKNTEFSYLAGRNGTNDKIGNGAVITHIDFTKNHSVGYGNEQLFIKSLSAHCIERSVSPFLYPNENTVEWFSKNVQGNGSSHRYLKCYAKACEFLQHIKKRTKNALHNEVDYFNKLVDYCIQNGVVREEHSFKSKWLKHRDLQFYGITKETDFLPYLNSITEIIERLKEVINMKLDSVADQLRDQGICNSIQAANSTEGYYQKWLHGQYIERDRKFRTHRKRLLQIGIDISVKLDISRAPIRLMEQQILVIKPLQKPDWYIDAVRITA